MRLAGGQPLWPPRRGPAHMPLLSRVLRLDARGAPLSHAPDAQPLEESGSRARRAPRRAEEEERPGGRRKRGARSVDDAR
jgi:hypothetical protein